MNSQLEKFCKMQCSHGTPCKFLVMSWQVGAPTVRQASLATFAVPSGAGRYVMATILGACLVSFAITHLIYFRAMRAEIRALVSSK